MLSNNLAVAAILPAAIAISSCGISPQETAFTLPAWPPEDEGAFPPLAYWEVRCCTGDGRSVLVLPGSGSRNVQFTLELAPDELCCITAYPVTKHGSKEASFFKPAGCVYPGETELSWQQGFAASVCTTLMTDAGSLKPGNAAYLARFNWRKLAAETDRKAAGCAGAYNPWNLDKAAICSAIEEHAFSTALLTVKNCFVVDTSRIIKPAGTHAGPLLLLCDYIPLQACQETSGSILASRSHASKYLYTIQSIIYITGTSADDITLEISAVPLYTGRK